MFSLNNDLRNLIVPDEVGTHRDTAGDTASFLPWPPAWALPNAQGGLRADNQYFPGILANLSNLDQPEARRAARLPGGLNAQGRPVRHAYQVGQMPPDVGAAPGSPAFQVSHQAAPGFVPPPFLGAILRGEDLFAGRAARLLGFVAHVG